MCQTREANLRPCAPVSGNEWASTEKVLERSRLESLLPENPPGTTFPVLTRTDRSFLCGCVAVHDSHLPRLPSPSCQPSAKAQ